eukprot:m51a1_g13660 hypothetical protein (95) ;mRNA; f:1572-2002
MATDGLAEAMFAATPRCELVVAMLDSGVTHDAASASADRISRVAAAYGATDHLVRSTLCQEISVTKSVETLWRTNSAATRVMAAALFSRRRPRI